MKQKNKISLIITLIVSVGVFFTFCKKGSNPFVNDGLDVSASDFSKISQRLVNGMGNINYNSQLQMLEFTDLNQFNLAISKLEENLKNYQLDKGNTQMLLSALNTCNISEYNNAEEEDDDDENEGTSNSNIIHLLRKNVPLSDTVLLTFLRKNFPINKVKQVLMKNIDFTDRVSDFFDKMNLPQAMVNQINQKRVDHVPYYPIYDDFEKLFPGYVSYKKYINEQERLYILAGNNPKILTSNPKYIGKTLHGAEAVLFNKYKEVKIGNAIYKIMDEQNVVIKNGSLTLLNQIRQLGKVPQYSPPLNEPLNGILKSQAPAIVDTNIVIDPTNIYNIDCGGPIEVGDAAGRLSFSVKAGGSGYKYYWDFGDGYISYKANPTHNFVSSSKIVTVTIYDPQGYPCGSSSANVGAGNTGTSLCGNGFISATNDGGYHGTINCTALFNNYTNGSAISYTVNYGDGTADQTGTTYNQQITFTNYYPSGINKIYTPTVILNYNGCKVFLSYSLLIKENSSTQNCCDKRDKEKIALVDNFPDITKYFIHKIVLHNVVFMGGRFTADVNTYKYIKFIGFFPSWSQGCVDLTGNYLTTNSLDNPCASAVTTAIGVQDLSTNSYQACGGSPNHGASWPTFGHGPHTFYLNYSLSNSPYIMPQSIGTAFGGTSILVLTPCD